MNKWCRKQISEAVDLLRQAKEILRVCAEEEQEYFDNMPESIRSGERGTAAKDAITALEKAADMASGAAEAADALAA